MHEADRTQTSSGAEDAREVLGRKQEELIDQLPHTFKGRLEALNDGIIAIYITIMLLAIPAPTRAVSYADFLHDIAIFLVSFFVVADFWYDLCRIFAGVEKASHAFIIADFCQLAVMALIPVGAKWIMNDPSALAVANYGIIYLANLLLQNVLFMLANSEQWKALGMPASQVFSRTIERMGVIALLNIGLILLAGVYPQPVMFLYLALPLLSFFMPRDHIKDRSRR